MPPIRIKALPIYDLFPVLEEVGRQDQYLPALDLVQCHHVDPLPYKFRQVSYQYLDCVMFYP